MATRADKCIPLLLLQTAAATTATDHRRQVSIALRVNHQQFLVLYRSRQVQVRKCTLLTCQIRCRADKCIPLASLQTATGTAVRTYIPGTCIPGIYIAL